jgi:hypothetical protein
MLLIASLVANARFERFLTTLSPCAREVAAEPLADESQDSASSASGGRVG